jgi:hypothetical protein
MHFARTVRIACGRPTPRPRCLPHESSGLTAVPPPTGIAADDGRRTATRDLRRPLPLQPSLGVRPGRSQPIVRDRVDHCEHNTRSQCRHTPVANYPLTSISASADERRSDNTSTVGCTSCLIKTRLGSYSCSMIWLKDRIPSTAQICLEPVYRHGRYLIPVLS